MTENTNHPRTIGGDRPIEKRDDDRLGYRNFAEAVARGIAGMRGSDGAVLAVHGPWGSGKTSAVNMIVEALSDDDRGKEVLVVRFNPWWFSEQQDLVRVFFREVGAALDGKVSDKVQNGLKKVAAHISQSKALITMLASLIPGGNLAAGPVADIVARLGSNLDDTTSLDEERKKLSEALEQQDQRILVIVDDIDRLPANEARQMFRLVKSVADLPNIVYLLVFDRGIVERALDQLHPADPDGPHWLEKIVQASFDLPPVRPGDLHALLDEGLNEIFATAETGDQVRWMNVFHDCVAPYLKTPRDVHRLLNALRVSWPSIEGEANVADFVAVETLRLFEPNVFKVVRNE